MNFPPNEDPAIQSAVQSLLELYSFARSRQRTAVRTFVLIAVTDHEQAAVLIAGCDSDQCREDAIEAATTIREIPKTTIN